MGRIATTRGIVAASWAVVRKDRSLLWLPVLSFAASAVTAALFAAGFVAVRGPGTTTTPGAGGTTVTTATTSPTTGVWGLAVTFVLVLVLAVITVFFQAALVSGAAERLRGGDPTLDSALGGALAHLGAIVQWALISATITTVLRSVQRNSGLVGRIVTGAAGIAWSVVTFLVLPIVVVEGCGVREAFDRARSMFRRTWGEQVVGNTGIGVVAVLAALPAVIVGVLSISPGTGTASVSVSVVGLVVAAVWIAVVATVAATLNGVFRTALYLYASTGAAPTGFDAQLLGPAPVATGLPTPPLG